MDKFSTIISGWRNHLVPPKALKGLIEELSTHRLGICKDCPSNSSNGHIETLSTCKECGCPLIIKSKSFSASCPLGKWQSYTSDDERAQINKEIENSHEIESE